MSNHILIFYDNLFVSIDINKYNLTKVKYNIYIIWQLYQIAKKNYSEEISIQISENISDNYRLPYVTKILYYEIMH